MRVGDNFLCSFELETYIDYLLTSGILNAEGSISDQTIGGKKGRDITEETDLGLVAMGQMRRSPQVYRADLTCRNTILVATSSNLISQNHWLR